MPIKKACVVFASTTGNKAHETSSTYTILESVYPPEPEGAGVRSVGESVV